MVEAVPAVARLAMLSRLLETPSDPVLHFGQARLKANRIGNVQLRLSRDVDSAEPVCLGIERVETFGFLRRRHRVTRHSLITDSLCLGMGALNVEAGGDASLD